MSIVLYPASHSLNNNTWQYFNYIEKSSASETQTEKEAIVVYGLKVMKINELLKVKKQTNAVITISLTLWVFYFGWLLIYSVCIF